MKLNAFVLAGMAVMASAIGSVQAKADGPDHGYRYQTTYAQWDAGFYGYYNYSETCNRTYTGYGVMKTCYDSSIFTPSTSVYIEELRTQEGYERVRVFRGANDVSPYITYYVYDNGAGVRRVERRDFSSDPYFATSYESTYYVTETQIWNVEDFDHGWENVMIGEFSVNVGIDVLEHSQNTVDTILGLGSLAFGSLSIVKGSQQIQRSSLETVIVDKTYYGGTDVR